VLAGLRDQAQVLRQHEQWLRSEQHRLGRLTDTVAHTITSLEGGTAMSAPELFEGFADRQAQGEQALAGRFGKGVRKHFAGSRWAGTSSIETGTDSYRLAHTLAHRAAG
jgi:hypothetical protein